jgi:hypothetical protein
MIQAFYFTVCVFIPLIFLLLLGTIFVFGDNISLKSQLEIFMWTEITYAWSAIDVITMAIVMLSIMIK